jgi:hypothetical protein
MMRLRRAAVVVLLSLLLWAATAYAECAWALWEEVLVVRDKGHIVRGVIGDELMVR